jgi:hypothetical protein
VELPPSLEGGDHLPKKADRLKKVSKRPESSQMLSKVGKCLQKRGQTFLKACKHVQALASTRKHEQQACHGSTIKCFGNFSNYYFFVMTFFPPF